MIYVYTVRSLLFWRSNYDFTTKNDRKKYIQESSLWCLRVSWRFPLMVLWLPWVLQELDIVNKYKSLKLRNCPHRIFVKRTCAIVREVATPPMWLRRKEVWQGLCLLWGLMGGWFSDTTCLSVRQKQRLNKLYWFARIRWVSQLVIMSVGREKVTTS